MLETSGSAFKVRRTDHPSISGIKISKVITSGLRSRAKLIPSFPFGAITTLYPSFNNCRFISSLTVGSSSIIKIVFPVLFSKVITFSIKEPVFCCKFFKLSDAPMKSARNVAVKVVPFPNSLFTTTSPPINIASCFDIVSPNPVPPYFLVVELSAWTNELNNLDICSSDIPIPVSFTSIEIRSPPSRKILFTPTVIFPFSVNLQALEIKFNTTCLTLVWSAVTKSISVL